MPGEGAVEVKLLGAAVSPFAVLVCMALELKGVSYEYADEDMGNKSELLLRSNPVHKKVPVLIHGGKPVSESLAIVEYVDKLWDAAGTSSILPADPYQRATARFWAAYTDGRLFPAYFGVQKAATEEERAEKVSETVAVIGQLEAALVNGKPFFAGDHVGYLDIVVGCHLFWLEALSRMFGVALVDAAKAPLFAAWAERFGEAEVATKGAVPNADKVVEYFVKKRQDNRAAPAGTAAK